MCNQHRGLIRICNLDTPDPDHKPGTTIDPFGEELGHANIAMHKGLESKDIERFAKHLDVHRDGSFSISGSHIHC
jgi:hypothetical protein